MTRKHWLALKWVILYLVHLAVAVMVTTDTVPGWVLLVAAIWLPLAMTCIVGTWCPCEEMPEEKAR